MPSPTDLRHMGDELATESAAFLSGTYAETVGSRARPVPAWAWTNLLAHGASRELRTQARALDQGLLHTKTWLAARAYLANEIMERVDRGMTLQMIQREVLIPVERAMMERSRRCAITVPSGVAPSVTEWVGAVRAALAVYDVIGARSGTAPGR